MNMCTDWKIKQIRRAYYASGFHPNNLIKNIHLYIATNHHNHHNQYMDLEKFQIHSVAIILNMMIIIIVIVALTGALYVMICYYRSGTHFLNFHSAY